MAAPLPPRAGLVLSPEQRRRQRQRNVALALGLVAMMVLFYVVTLVKIGAPA